MRYQPFIAMVESRAASQPQCCPGLQGTSFGVPGDRLSVFDDDDDIGVSDNGPVFIEDWTRWADGERQEVHIMVLGNVQFLDLRSGNGPFHCDLVTFNQCKRNPIIWRAAGGAGRPGRRRRRGSPGRGKALRWRLWLPGEEQRCSWRSK